MNLSIKHILCTTAITLFFLIGGCIFKQPIKIGIQPYEQFNTSLTDTVASALRQTYGAEIYLMYNQPLPAEAFIHTKTSRYRADTLIRLLKTNKPDFVDYFVGLTTQDISFTKRDSEGKIKKPENTYSDWGIFGLGYMPGNSCVVSSYRLQHKDQTIFIDRLKKVAIHELGHNLGLPHCDTKGCVMQDAVESIQTIDKADASLCTKCKKRIK